MSFLIFLFSSQLANIYSFTLPSSEVIVPNLRIGRVSAVDQDSDSNGAVKYALTNGTDLEAFTIDPDHGDIMTTKELTEER